MLAAIPFQIDLTEATIEKGVKFTVFNKITWGWSILIAGLFDFYSAFVLSNGTEGNFGGVDVW